MDDWLVERFEEQRPRLRALAYRMTGSLDEADDAVQDAWLRVSRAGAHDVANLGGWLTTKEFVVPAERIRASAKHENDFEVHLSKSQIEDFPPYNQKDVETEKTWNDYENRYRSKWVDGPVMHREATDRNITPTTQQMPPSAAAAGPRATGDVDTGRIIPAGTDTVVIASSAPGIGGRWDTFQSRLRERRKQSATGTGTLGSESASDFRKAV